MGAVVVAFGIGQRCARPDVHDSLHPMLCRLREGKETVGQHPRLCPFEYLHIDLDLLHSGGVSQAETHMDWLGDLRACFDNQFAHDGIWRFFQIHAESWNGPMTEDTVPVRHDMRDARIVEDRWFGSDHREGPSQLIKIRHSYRLLHHNERRPVSGNDRRLRVGRRRTRCVQRTAVTLDRQ